MQGNVTNVATVERAIKGQDAVLCALGAATPLRRDNSLIEGVQHIVDVMSRFGTRRLVYLSFLGVRDGRPQLSFIGRTVLAPPLLHNVVADHEVKERIIQHSGLDWTIVRAPRLTNGTRKRCYRYGIDIRAEFVIPRISRADIADFMLRQIGDDAYVHRAPAVMYWSASGRCASAVAGPPRRTTAGRNGQFQNERFLDRFAMVLRNSRRGWFGVRIR